MFLLRDSRRFMGIRPSGGVESSNWPSVSTIREWVQLWSEENTAHSYENRLLMQKSRRDAKRSQSPVRAPEQRSSVRSRVASTSSTLVAIGASTQKPQHIKDTFRRLLPSYPVEPDCRLDQHGAGSADPPERLHRGAERSARRASHSSSPYRAREPRPPQRAPTEQRESAERAARRASHSSSHYRAREPRPRQHATVAQRAPDRLVRSATQAMAPVLREVSSEEGGIVTSEEKPEDKVAAWLAKTDKFSPLSFPSACNKDLAMQPRRTQATYSLAVRWLFAHLWATLVGFCTFLARGVSVAVAAVTRTDDERDASDSDAASSNASSASEDGTMTLEKAQRRLGVARRGVDKAAQRLLRAQNRAASWQHQVAQMQEADKKRDNEKWLNKCRHRCGASSLEKSYLATI